jgi:hypothetical protein
MVGKPERRRTLGRPRPKWQYNIERDVQEIEWYAVNWINLTRHKDRRHNVLNTIIIHPLYSGGFLG